MTESIAHDILTPPEVIVLLRLDVDRPSEAAAQAALDHLCRTRQLRSVIIGHRRRFTRQAINDFIERCTIT